MEVLTIASFVLVFVRMKSKKAMRKSIAVRSNLTLDSGKTYVYAEDLDLEKDDLEKVDETKHGKDNTAGTD